MPERLSLNWSRVGFIAPAITDNARPGCARRAIRQGLTHAAARVKYCDTRAPRLSPRFNPSIYARAYRRRSTPVRHSSLTLCPRRVSSLTVSRSSSLAKHKSRALIPSSGISRRGHFPRTRVFANGRRIEEQLILESLLREAFSFICKSN